MPTVAAKLEGGVQRVQAMTSPFPASIAWHTPRTVNRERGRLFAGGPSRDQEENK